MKLKPVYSLSACLFAAGAGLAACTGAGDQPLTPVAYPEGYRAWAHVKSMVLQQGHPLFDAFGGIHHVYANPAALNAMKAKQSYPDGAVLVFDLLEAKSDGNAIVEGARTVIGVMAKSSAAYAATGGWGFAGFKGDTRENVVTDPKNQCYGCHAPQTQTDGTFTTYRP